MEGFSCSEGIFWPIRNTLVPQTEQVPAGSLPAVLERHLRWAADLSLRFALQAIRVHGFLPRLDERSLDWIPLTSNVQRAWDSCQFATVQSRGQARGSGGGN